MAAQKGRDVLLRVRKDHTDQSYETLAGLRKRQFRFRAPGIDSTHVESASGWRELMAGAGQKSIDIAGEGVFVDAASDAKLSAAFFELETPDFELVVPDFAIIRGAFLISELNYGGQHDGELDFSIILKSAGEITLEAI